MRLSSLIRTKRVSKGYSQLSLAKLMGVNSNMIYRIENCNQAPNFKAACQISEILGLDIRIMKSAVLKESTGSIQKASHYELCKRAKAVLGE